MPRASAHSAASSRLSAEVKREGISTPITLRGPSASAAMAAVRAESMPPDSPSTAFRKPFLVM